MVSIRRAWMKAQAAKRQGTEIEPNRDRKRLRIVCPDLQKEPAIKEAVEDMDKVVKLENPIDGAHKAYHLVVLELFGGCFYDWNEFRDPLDERESAKVVASIARALKEHHVHASGIIGGDPEPVVKVLIKFFQNGEAGYVTKLTDFGNRACQLETNDPTKTWVYMAPESLVSDLYSEASDVWSLGMILYTCLTARLPFDVKLGRDWIKCLLEIIQRKGKHVIELLKWDNVSAEAKKLIQQMTDVSAEKRLTIDQVLENEWIRNNC